MAWFIGQSLFMIALAFGLGLLVGWLWWGRRRSASPATAADAGTVAVPEEADSEAVAEPEEAITEPERAVRVPHLVPAVAAEPAGAVEPAAGPEPAAAGPEPAAAGPEPAAAGPEPAAVEPVVMAGPAVARRPAAGKPAASESAASESAASESAASESAGTEPEDDLKRIEGIGPKMSAALRNAGIRTYARLAGTDVTELRSAIEAAGLTFAPSLVTWAAQARLLADGDEAGFADLTRRLVAGRDTGRS